MKSDDLDHENRRSSTASRLTSFGSFNSVHRSARGAGADTLYLARAMKPDRNLKRRDEASQAD